MRVVINFTRAKSEKVKQIHGLADFVVIGIVVDAVDGVGGDIEEVEVEVIVEIFGDGSFVRGVGD